MRFPVEFDHASALPGDRCNYCGVNSITPEFVSLSLGAMQDHAGPVVDLSEAWATMQLDWQGPGESQGTGFPVVAGTTHGGCVLNFCSTRCLRRFFTDCVDHLERLIETIKGIGSLAGQEPRGI